MSVDTFNKFRLSIHLIRVDYQQEENYLFFFLFFFLGDLFNREGDLILSDVDLINVSHQTCSGWKNFFFIDFKKIYPLAIIRTIYDGLCAIEKECAD